MVLPGGQVVKGCQRRSAVRQKDLGIELQGLQEFVSTSFWITHASPGRDRSYDREKSPRKPHRAAQSRPGPPRVWRTQLPPAASGRPPGEQLTTSRRTDPQRRKEDKQLSLSWIPKPDKTINNSLYPESPKLIKRPESPFIAHRPYTSPAL